MVAILANWKGFGKAKSLGGVTLGQFTKRQHEGHVALGALGHFQSGVCHLLGIPATKAGQEIFKSRHDFPVASGFTQKGTRLAGLGHNNDGCHLRNRSRRGSGIWLVFAICSRCLWQRACRPTGWDKWSFVFSVEAGIDWSV
ncbi:MAG: hypothetical protein ACKOLA_12685, partial [Spartobacteria bacterium]